MAATPRDPHSSCTRGGPTESELEPLLAEAGWVRALARRLARDQTAAEDVAQGALTLALERRPEPGDSLRPWLARVVARLATRHGRSESRRRAREDRAAAAKRPSSPGSDELLARLEEQERLATDVRALPEPYRGVVLRRYYEGLSTAEIARVTGRSPATVRSQLARGLERLRARCTERHGAQAVLPFLLLAAGSSGGWIPRALAEVIVMKSSTKVALGTAVVALALTGVGWMSGLFSPVEDEAPIAALRGLDQASATPIEPEVAPESSEARALASSTVEEPVAAAASAPSALEPEPLTRVRARIADATGHALAGATLTSIYVSGRPRGPHAKATAADDGTVVLEIADADMRARDERVFPMVFAAESPGHATHFALSTPIWHGEVDLGELRLEVGGAIAGSIVDPDGLPVANAVVYAGEAVLLDSLEGLRRSGPDTSIVRPRTDSDAQGRFHLDGVELGARRLWIHATGFRWTISDPLDVDAAGTVEGGRFVLQRVPLEDLVRGTVRRPNGDPAAGALVSYIGGTMQREGTLEADSEGRFQFTPKGRNATGFLARDPLGESGQSDLVYAQPGEEIVLDLSEARSIAVRIVEPGGEPVEGAAIMPFRRDPAWGPDATVPYPGQDWIRTDADGYATVPVPVGEFIVSASLRGYEPCRAGPWLPTSAPLTLELELVPTPRVEGHVRANGEPIAGAKVNVAQNIEGFVPIEAGFPTRFFLNAWTTVESDENGFFSVPVEKDWTDVSVLARADGFAIGELRLLLQAGVGAEDVEIGLVKGATLEGVVIPPTGRLARGIVVAASRGDGFPVWTRADDEGRYRLEHLAPGSWRVEGRDQEPSKEVLSVANKPEEKDFRWNVELRDGRDARFDVDMRGLGTLEFVGRFLIDGEPAKGWTVELELPMTELQRRELPAAELDSTGRFDFPIAAGRYEMHLRGELPGGVTVEVVRELDLSGERVDWEETLSTGPLKETVDGQHDRVRLVRGNVHQGGHEFTWVPLDEGRCDVRVPVGEQSLQVSVGMSDWGEMWDHVRTVDVR